MNFNINFLKYYIDNSAFLLEEKHTFYNYTYLSKNAEIFFNIKPKDCLNIVQRLYELGFISYPRTSDFYKDNEYFNQTSVIFDNISHIINFDISFFNLDKKPDSIDSNKTGLHEAISVTDKKVDMFLLNPQERDIYLLISIRYLIQFLPNIKELRLVHSLNNF